jgi:mono/diheme cytochrome c family protein
MTKTLHPWLFRGLLMAALGGVAIATFHAGTALSKDTTPSPVARGRYIIETAGCNDCHTPGYAPSNGEVPEEFWLTGDRLGWRGPWGTTYATNLRLSLNAMSEAQWLHYARAMQPRPPMPWFNVHAMNDEDLRAIYQYVKALGPAGEPAPAYVPPDREPEPPYVQFPG